MKVFNYLIIKYLCCLRTMSGGDTSHGRERYLHFIYNILIIKYLCCLRTMSGGDTSHGRENWVSTICLQATQVFNELIIKYLCCLCTMSGGDTSHGIDISKTLGNHPIITIIPTINGYHFCTLTIYR
jgi:hypothetical protein